MQKGQSRADFMTAYQSATEHLPVTASSDLDGRRKELEGDSTASTSAAVNSNGMSTGGCFHHAL